MIAHLVAGNQSDLEVALGFLRIARLVSSIGEIRKARGVYVCTVRLSRPYKDVADQISARFGRFVQLRKE